MPPKLKPYNLILSSLTAALLFFIFTGTLQAQSPDSTRQQIIENIEIVGNSKTHPNVILRHMTIRKGDPVDVDAITASIQRLSQTNFFKEVDFYTKPGSEKGKLIVVIEIRERKWPYFQFEGGHSDLDGWYFVPASLRFDNLFGQGNYFGARYLLGHRTNQTAIGFRTPNLFSNRAFLDIELHGGDQRFIHYLDNRKADQKVNFGGLRFRMGGNHGLWRFVHLTYRGVTYRPDPFAEISDTDERLEAEDLPDDIADDLAETQIRMAGIGLFVDTRDNPVYPRKGVWGALTAETSGFNSDIDFSRVTLDSRFYRNFPGKQVLAAHVKLGYSSADAPFYERFFLGGANSLRGYGDARLTPEGWGTKLFLSNIEFRIPISKRNYPFHKSSLVLFFDAGGIWQADESPKAEDIFTALGFGFRVQLPVVGTTRFDFSFPLRNVDNNDFQFHISLGHTF